MSGTWKRWQDWLTVVIGVLLVVAPFALGATANQAAAWSACAGGILLAVASLWSLTRPSPAKHPAEWAEIVIGVLAVVLAGSVVFNERGRPQLVGQRSKQVTVFRESGLRGRTPRRMLTHDYTITPSTERAAQRTRSHPRAAVCCDFARGVRRLRMPILPRR